MKANGADQVVDYVAEPFEKRVKKVDAVLDTVGGPVRQISYGVLKPNGALVAITRPPSPDEATKHQVQASFLITEVSTNSLEKVAKMIDDGEIKPFVGRVYQLEEVREAWKDVQSNQVEGKVVFSVA